MDIANAARIGKIILAVATFEVTSVKKLTNVAMIKTSTMMCSVSK